MYIDCCLGVYIPFVLYIHISSEISPRENPHRARFQQVICHDALKSREAQWKSTVQELGKW